MKLSGIFVKIPVIIRTCSMIYTENKGSFKAVCGEQEVKGWFFYIDSQQFILKLTFAKSSVQGKLPKNTFNFTVKYIKQCQLGQICINGVYHRLRIVPSVFGQNPTCNSWLSNLSHRVALHGDMIRFFIHS